MTTLRSTSDNGGPPSHEGAQVSIRRIKQRARTRKLRAIQELASRVQECPDGERTFVRFSRGQRFEHQLLIVSFGTLALTGLMQTFSDLRPVGYVTGMVGGIDTLRMIHHLAAIILMVQSVYHTVRLIEGWAVRRERGAMWPRMQDLHNLVQMVRFNLGLTESRPEFGRFTIEEKLEYWAMLWGTPLMGITGLILWFPSVLTSFLPGEIVPVALALHRWEAKLAALAILTWHTYNVLIKEVNLSIFTGTLSEKEMQHSHPLEYRRIMAAYQYLQDVAEGDYAQEPEDTHRLPQPMSQGTPLRAEIN